MRPVLVLLSALLLTACPQGPATCEPDFEDCGPDDCDGDDGDDEMMPGSPCISCHSPGNLDDRSEARDDDDDDDEYFTLAGTVYLFANGGEAAEGAIVEVTDDGGNVIRMTANAAGNFSSWQAVTPPLRATVEYEGEVLEMRGTFDEGDCNACHACAGEAGEKIYAVPE